jgi:hypothetical protein
MFLRSIENPDSAEYLALAATIALLIGAVIAAARARSHPVVRRPYTMSSYAHHAQEFLVAAGLTAVVTVNLFKVHDANATTEYFSLFCALVLVLVAMWKLVWSLVNSHHVRAAVSFLGLAIAATLLMDGIYYRHMTHWRGLGVSACWVLTAIAAVVLLMEIRAQVRVSRQEADNAAASSGSSQPASRVAS